MYKDFPQLNSQGDYNTCYFLIAFVLFEVVLHEFFLSNLIPLASCSLNGDSLV